ncbi:MAG: inositol monophosphatase [Candidatus Pacebacteria bacterium]|jgi:myo-inositol-1(or 4)-monophosphatase|nr:inositol monophosphatase [Candidatus Paceibacterota bacterium]MBT4652201.1 inositol monophosphatase [Candidatus Paceibacterota bacterium]MBT6756632.1 inositol monophosphatase [Candidatus Paceibacterota bacterium]MBT6920905.1 inositol monophosphatase [Candidatus Paceibacterota bacterium]
MLDFKKVHEVILEILKTTDQKIVDGFNSDLEVKDKGGRVESNPVTEVDGAVEDFLKDQLSEAFPEVGFVGEERDNNTKDEYNWVVDPIDGTKNFSLKVPVFCTSIALWKNNKPVYGMMSFPMQNLRVHVIDGKGIFVNEKKHLAENKESVQKTPLILFNMVGNHKLKAEMFVKILEDMFSPRYFGSAVYHLMMVGLGKADVVALWNLAPWDLGVAKLLMQEAGLEYRYVGEDVNLDLEGKEPYRFKIVVGKQPFVDKIASFFEEALDKKEK